MERKVKRSSPTIDKDKMKSSDENKRPKQPPVVVKRVKREKQTEKPVTEKPALRREKRVSKPLKTNPVQITEEKTDKVTGKPKRIIKRRIVRQNPDSTLRAKSDLIATGEPTPKTLSPVTTGETFARNKTKWPIESIEAANKTEVKDEKLTEVPAMKVIQDDGKSTMPDRAETSVCSNGLENKYPPCTEDDKKIFVGGLSDNTKEKDLIAYFEKFGNIEFVNMIRDHFTGEFRGFSFVTFISPTSVDNVVKYGTHKINGINCSIYRANPRSGRLFVGNLNEHISDSDIHECFERFGKIIKIERSSVPQKSRNFCFVVFQSMDSVKEVLRQGKIMLKEHEVEVELARRRTNQSWWVSSNRANNVNPIERNENSEEQKRTIFIGGLSCDTNEKDLDEYFRKFGCIESVKILLDRFTKNSRGFGFVVFLRPESVDEVVKNPMHTIKGKVCGARKADRNARSMTKVRPPGWEQVPQMLTTHQASSQILPYHSSPQQTRVMTNRPRNCMFTSMPAAAANVPQAMTVGANADNDLSCQIMILNCPTEYSTAA